MVFSFFEVVKKVVCKVLVKLPKELRRTVGKNIQLKEKVILRETNEDLFYSLIEQSQSFSTTVVQIIYNMG